MGMNFLDDLTHTHNIHRLEPAIQKAIRWTMRKRGEETLTDFELRRRFDLCWEIAKNLRYDLAWGVARIADYLPRYLYCELEGIAWEPDRRTCWLPGDGA